jgi:hypothetical protein
VFVLKQKFVEDALETIAIVKGRAKGLDSDEGRETWQHSGVRIIEIEAAKRQENTFVWKKGLNEGGVYEGLKGIRECISEVHAGDLTKPEAD